MAVDLDGGLAGDHDHQLPEDLLRLRDEYFSDGQDIVTLRMLDVMPSIERWTFAAEHGFDLCAEMGSPATIPAPPIQPTKHKGSWSGGCPHGLRGSVAFDQG